MVVHWWTFADRPPLQYSETFVPQHFHLTTTTQFDRAWAEQAIFERADRFKDGNGLPALEGQALYCLFYEPSFVTRASFERAFGLLRGTAYQTEDASQFFPIQTPSYIDDVIQILASLRFNVVVLRSSGEGIIERASAVDAVPVINGGSLDDHPTQALADLYTIARERGAVDGARVAVVGRLEHRNVSALLNGLALYDDVTVSLVPFSGQIDPAVRAYCESKGLCFETRGLDDGVEDADVIYLNGPRTVAHAQLLKSRDVSLVIDGAFMERLKPSAIIMHPMQRSGDFTFQAADRRIVTYRQAENALFVRMALLAFTLGG